MVAAEKYRALRSFTFNGRKFETGDAIARSYILEVAPEKEGTLLRTGFIEAPNFTGSYLSRRKKDELVDFAETVGARVSSAWRKDEIIEAIEETL